MKWNRRIVAVVSILPLTCSLSAMAIEEPHYTVISAEGPFEVREYAGYRVAQTLVEGRFEEVGNEAFRRLFAYISGANRASAKITMTAPVEQQAAAQPAPVKIPMTAPVEQQAVGDRWRVAFVLPASYTIDSAPQPTDERVQIAEVAPRRVAVLRYRGTWSLSRYDEHLAQLRGFITTHRMIATGEPIWDRYDPPFMPWFLRRNEIQIPVQAGNNTETPPAR
jgi:hypothetical protein